MWLLGLVAAAVLGGAVIDLGAAWAEGVARAAVVAPSADARADARVTPDPALACTM
jgi:hypothetical protein